MSHVVAISDPGPREGDDAFDAGRGVIEVELHKIMSMAVRLGFVVTVELEPQRPLAMRNYRHVIHVRRAR